jgi:hypothetical protein
MTTEQLLKQQIEQWQSKWDILQQSITFFLKAKDIESAFKNQIKAGTLKGCIQDCYNLLEQIKSNDNEQET